MEIKEGMVVYLKSGSPAMTVGNEMSNSNWQCSWFHGTELRQGTFHARQLTDKKPAR